LNNENNIPHDSIFFDFLIRVCGELQAVIDSVYVGESCHFRGMVGDIYEVFILPAHFLKTLMTLSRPGGLTAIVSESLTMKQQFQVMKRSRWRAPRLFYRDYSFGIFLHWLLITGKLSGTFPWR
jgi:hypothetical protein